jgi:hypothetical protein
MPYVEGSTKPTSFTCAFQVGTGVETVVGTGVCDRDCNGVTGTPFVPAVPEGFNGINGVGTGVADDGSPIFTGWPVAMGFMTRAMIRRITSARIPYITAFLSIADSTDFIQ